MVCDLSNRQEGGSESAPCRPLILPVASGKGGVGKSFLAANLALAFAARGRRTILGDLDFGCSSLHRFLGLPNRHPGLSDFLCGHVEDLERLAVPTPWDRLRFLPGDGWTPLLANLADGRKRKLLRHLTRLSADILVLDLGAGSSLTTLDFFGSAEAGVLVATPDAVSLGAMLVFLKNDLHRRIEKRLAARKHPDLRRLLRAERERPLASQASTLEEFTARLAAAFPPAADEIRSLSAALRPRVVFNRVVHAEDTRVAAAIENVLRLKLGVTPEFCGFIREDPAVGEALRRGRAYLAASPAGPAAEDLHRLAARIDRPPGRPAPETADPSMRPLIRIPARSLPERQADALRGVSSLRGAVRIVRGFRS